MKQETFVVVIGVLLTVAAAIAIGGLPFGGGGNNLYVSDTVPMVEVMAATTVPESSAPESSAPETTAPDDSVPERAVPSANPTITTSSGGSSASTPPTSADIASAGPIPTTAATEPNDSDDSNDGLRDRDSLVVAVANASGLEGVSASIAAELEGAGYVGVATVGAVQPSSTSAIYFAPNLDREAFLATADLRWDGVELLAMALAPEIRPPGEFDVLFLLGNDRAAPALQP